ncbi:helix-turn-helix domain-containing protein [Desulfovibrio ferrophilus]|uniref:Transcriptional regulator, XRE family n=1 Tax=Desulfovibrio ferrophilus TaxID=241368 RepID=A0A2Z6B0N5_9BACT|nr:XRE family transcriptional regulator [Desulfovibrio ferrophilus]BBD09008.1 transcriptional regulator, XRE family [Desulfovibrio ferrophilus]
MENGKIGIRIKSYRESKDLSVEQMAEKTGLDAAFIVAIENQTASPALGPLVKIARALGVRLGTFTDDALTDDPLIHRLVDRKLDSEPLASGEKHPEMTYQHLGKGKADRHMEPFFIRLEPEGDEPEMSSHEGEEFVVVMSGEVVLRYGQEVHILTPGDSMYYNSVVPHHVGSKGPGPAEIYAVVYVPF